MSQGPGDVHSLEYALQSSLSYLDNEIEVPDEVAHSGELNLTRVSTTSPHAARRALASEASSSARVRKGASPNATRHITACTSPTTGSWMRRSSSEPGPTPLSSLSDGAGLGPTVSNPSRGGQIS